MANSIIPAAPKAPSMPATEWKIQPEHFLAQQAKGRMEAVTTGKAKAAILDSSEAIPQHLRTINTEHGTVLYDPKKVRARGIRRSLRFGNFHELVEGAPKPSLKGLTSLFRAPKSTK